MKKRFFALAFALMVLFSAAALGEISLTKRDIALNTELDKNVSHILVLLQDGDRTDTMMLASINSRTGRSVELGEVYNLGAEKSRGLLALRTVNTLLNLNASTYVALDVERMPELVEAIGTLNMQLDEEEAAAMGTWSGINELSGDDVLTYVRLELASDSPARSRGYDALMQMLYQGMHSGDLMGMMSLGTRLLSSLDTNLNPMTALTLVSAVQAGDDRREMLLPQQEQVTSESPLRADGQAMQQALHKEIYE